MSSITIVIISAVLFAAAYRFYGGFIERRVFRAKSKNIVPSKELCDDVDYIPTNKEVLFGHHFASIAGTGPIVGPAIAIIWGWLPALVWIILGSIFAGAVHDYAALMMSTRNKGVSVGNLSREVISPRVRMLFMFVILFSLWIVVAIFGLVIALIFRIYPQAVMPVWIQIPIAMAVGWLAHKKKMNITGLSIVAVVLMYLSIIAGVHIQFILPVTTWIILLFAYAYIASVLPVWSLLQPRDYVNSHQLIVGIALILLGVFFARPEMVAPVIQMAPEGAPPILPFLFITIACGAISGFHSLVGSGTSSKQLKNERDVKFIAYGGMLTEGMLGVLVIVAVGAGIGMYARGDAGEVLKGTAAWQHYYSSWTAAAGLAAKVTAFVDGSANMLGALGIPLKYGQAIIGVLIASFAGTTLDTATRIQRYVITEMAVDHKIPFLHRRHPATALAVLSAAALAFSEAGGKGALMLWPLFGTSNQLLAGLVLLVATVYLMKRGMRAWPVVIPMIFMIVTSSWTMIVNVQRFSGSGQHHLFVIGILLLGLEAWMIFEALKCVKKHKRTYSARL